MVHNTKSCCNFLTFLSKPSFPPARPLASDIKVTGKRFMMKTFQAYVAGKRFQRKMKRSVCGKKEINFAQWRYSNQWSNREVLLLLVENYNQYPAPTRWNTLVCGNFWPALRGRNMTERLKQVLRWDRLGVGSAGHRTSLLGLLAKIKV